MTNNFNIQEAIDKLKVQELALNFIYRDRREWNKLADLFLPDAMINTSPFLGSISDFIPELSAWQDKISLVRHRFGAPNIKIREDKAMSYTDVVIDIRYIMNGYEVDLIVNAAFCELCVRQSDQWRIKNLNSIYQCDRLDPVIPDPSFYTYYKSLNVDKYPKQIRHVGAFLAYSGAEYNKQFIPWDSPKEKAVLEDGIKWLHSK